MSISKKKMILDLDTGIDDALALAYALADPDCDLIGIIGSYGNVYVEQGVQNSLDLLALLGANDVPVYSGAQHASYTDSFSVLPVSAQIHGKNGVANIKLSKAKRTPEKTSGVDFLIDAAHKYKDQLLFVPTGPLTNLAAAIEKDPTIIDLIGHVTLMGGALTVPGNVSPVAEANIHQDPEAANEVFSSRLPLTMVGLDVTTRTLLTRHETKHWRKLGTKAATVYADLVDYYIDAYKTTNPHLHGCALHDPLAVGVAIDPSLVEKIALNLKVEVKDIYEGRTIGDETRLNNPTVTTDVAVNVDKDRFLDKFMNRLTPLFAAH
ncbi:inosine-uridine preferring nucleoside hydrolase [Liquorilactobacillus sucicola DSM 21376 = JCM 15457]|uniref:Inosine-uridine preferring nucleoside hydrolase n=1 Tax=Liquorilactobacillus sucicola DSM 21376 = JCM 15457 TaxID=1423806 RepID=A0A023CUC2_9LACO|nr:inosine-uridine preferring nucleoside hydrolase [Liquorilactobacillus sucicola DSM 21376 = JCM 15457]GAJ25467.1 inosine-uridine preferring nucleoside hydrolase [Liquorilactobacillus sucicola DSM 21376 = JCM 15457]